MLIDDITIKVVSGKGGDGIAVFSKEMMTLGPTGGDGGDGGSVYFEGIPDIGALSSFRFKKDFVAESGKNGQENCRSGPKGEDLMLKVPLGTVIYNLDTDEKYEIVKIGKRTLVVKGGKGGRGNFSFRSSTKTSPEKFTYGREGEEVNIRLELKLIADIGLIGLPNVGKSTLLNELTGSKAKVANYKFTTLEPNLGVYYDLILADIPGLIEGASSGKGLGIKFLKHIERTRFLFHLISVESDDPVNDYKTIRKEMENYSEELANKPEYIIISKSDLVEKEKLDGMINNLKKFSSTVLPISIYDFDKMKELEKLLSKILEEIKENAAE